MMLQDFLALVDEYDIKFRIRGGVLQPLTSKFGPLQTTGWLVSSVRNLRDSQRDPYTSSRDTSARALDLSDADDKRIADAQIYSRKNALRMRLLTRLTENDGGDAD